MLSRLLPKPSNFRYLTLASSKLLSYPQPQFPSSPPTPTTFTFPSRFFSSKHNNNNNGKDRQDSDGVWKISEESDGKFEPFFSQASGKTAETDFGLKGYEGEGDDDWKTVEGYKAWSLVEEEKSDLFDIGDEHLKVVGESETGLDGSSSLEDEKKKEEAKRLEKEEQELTAILKGFF